jgi:hypothetical protein
MTKVKKDRRKYLFVSCNTKVTSHAIQCFSCAEWTHAKCTGIKITRSYKRNPTWTCVACALVVQETLPITNNQASKSQETPNYNDMLQPSTWRWKNDKSYLTSLNATACLHISQEKQKVSDVTGSHSTEVTLEASSGRIVSEQVALSPSLTEIPSVESSQDQDTRRRWNKVLDYQLSFDTDYEKEANISEGDIISTAELFCLPARLEASTDTVYRISDSSLFQP